MNVVMFSLFCCGLCCVLLCDAAAISKNQKECPETNVERQYLDHRWHTTLDKRQSVTDEQLHCILGSLTGGEDVEMLNITDITIKEKRHHQEIQHNDTQMMHFKEAYIPNTLLKRLSNDYISNLTAKEVKLLVESTDMSIDTVQHIFSNLNRTVFEAMMHEAAKESEMDLPEMYYHPMVDAGIHQYGPVEHWTPHEAEIMNPFLQGFTKQHIKELRPDTFQSMLPSLTKMINDNILENSVQKVVMEKYKESKGPVRSWTVEDLDQVEAFFPKLSRRDVKSIPDQVLNEFLDVADISIITSSPQIARDFVHRIIGLPSWNWSPDNITRLGDLVQFIPPRQMKNLPASVITMDVFTSSVKKRGKESRLIAKKVVEQRGDPSGWSTEDLRSVGKSVIGLNVRELERIPTEAILGAMDDLNEASMSPRQKKTLLKKVKGGDRKRITAEEINNLKGLSTMLKTDDLKELEGNDVLEAAETFRDIGKDLNKAKRKQIVEKASKVEGDVGALIGILGDDYLAEIPLKAVKTMSYADITSMSVAKGNQSAGASQVKWTKSQSKSLYRSIKKGLEEMEGEELTFTTDMIRNLGTIASGLPCEDIHKMSGDDVVSLVTALMEQDGWNNKQMRCIKDTLKESDVDFTSRLTESDITNLGGKVLKEFSVDDLSKIPEELQQLAYEEIGSSELTEDKKEKREWMAETALKAMDKSSDVPLTSDDLLTLGNLTCSLPSDAYTRIEVDAFTDNIYSLRACFLDLEQLDVVHDKLLDINGELTTWSGDTIATTGPLLSSFSRDEIMQLDEANFSSVAIETLNSFKEFKEEKANSIIDVDDEDEKRWAEGFTSVAVRTKEALVAESSIESRRRKKRDVVHSPSCEEIMDLQDGNIAWTVQELEAITTDSFHNCFDVLGVVANFSDDQLDTLLTKAIETWGSVSNISSDDISLLGRIATRFTPEQISQLDLSYLDTLYSIGQSDGWQKEQLESGLNRYLELTGWQVSDLNGTDLTGLSNFLCGMSLDQMLAISSESYSEASTDIGLLTTCSPQQLSVLKSKAVDQYGKISTWLPEIYTEVGTVIAGFSSADFVYLSEESLAAILPEALTLIPPETFKEAFNVKLVGYFDQYQAQAVTSQQRSILSSYVQDALNAAEYGGDVTILAQVFEEGATNNGNDSTNLGLNEYIFCAWITIFIHIVKLRFNWM